MRWLEGLFPGIASPLEGCGGLSPLSLPCLDQEPSCLCGRPLKRAPSRSGQAQGGFSQPARQPRPAAPRQTADDIENVWDAKKRDIGYFRNRLKMILWQVLLLLWRKLKEEDIEELKTFPNRVASRDKDRTIPTPVEENPSDEVGAPGRKTWLQSVSFRRHRVQQGCISSTASSISLSARLGKVTQGYPAVLKTQTQQIPEPRLILPCIVIPPYQECLNLWG